MKISYLLIASLLISFVCISCEEKPTEREILFDEVMDIHDTCMPEVVTLNQIKRSLRKSKEDIKGDSITVSKINSTIGAIEKANEGMMVWMRELVIPKDIDPDEKVVPYLKEEKIKIKKVSDAMFEALDDGNALLKDIKDKQ